MSAKLRGRIQASRLLAMGDSSAILFTLGKVNGKTDDEIASALRWSNEQLQTAKNRAYAKALSAR